MRESQEYLTKHGVIEVRQLNDVTEIYPRPTLVAMATKIWEF